MSPRAGSITPSPRVGRLTPSGSSNAPSIASSNLPHRTSYQMQLAQGHEREHAHHRESRESRKSVPSVPSPTASPHFPTPTPSFRRPSSVQSIHHQQQPYDERRAPSPGPRQQSPIRHPSPTRHYERHERYDYPRETYQETFHEAQYPSQPARVYDEHPPPNSQRPAGPYHRSQYTVEPTPPPSQPVRRTYTPIEAPQPQHAPRKTSSKATVEIFNKLIQLEHDVGGLRSEILHIRDTNHDVRTGLRALPTREEMRDEMREIMTSTLQETTATLATTLTESLGTSLASSLSTSLAASITESVTAALGTQVTEAVEKATRASTQSLPAITAHLVCEKTKAALSSSEKAVEAAVRSSIKSIQPPTVAPPGGTITALLRPINDMKTAFEESRVAESMRFVAGITDQISTKIAQLEVSVSDAVQGVQNQVDATVLQDALGGLKEQIAAITASIADLKENGSSSKDVEGSLMALETGVGDIKKSMGRLGVMEQHLAGIQNGCERTATSTEQQAATFQNLGLVMQSLAKDCATIPQLGEQLRTLSAAVNERPQQQALGKIALDLAALKSHGAALGPMSTRLETISTGVDALQTQCHEMGGQLQRLHAIETGMGNVQSGVDVLRRMDGTLSQIKTTLSTRPIPAPAEARSFQGHGRQAHITETPPSSPYQPTAVCETALSLRRTSNDVDSSLQAPSGTVSQSPAVPPSSYGSSISAVPVATQTTTPQPSSGHSTASIDPSTGDIPLNNVRTSADDEIAPAESGLHLLSAVASQATASETQAPRPASQSSTTPTGPEPLDTQGATPALTPDTSPSTSSVGLSTPRAPPAFLTGATTPTPSLPFNARGVEEPRMPVRSPTTPPQVGKGRQKWKDVRPTRRSTRIQAREGTRVVEQQPEEPQGQEGQEEPRQQRARTPEVGQSADNETDARLSLSAWLSGRKRKPQADPESRPTKRTTNNSLSSMIYSGGEGSGHGPSGSGDGQGGQGARGIWSWWSGGSASA